MAHPYRITIVEDFWSMRELHILSNWLIHCISVYLHIFRILLIILYVDISFNHSPTFKNCLTEEMTITGLCGSWSSCNKQHAMRMRNAHILY